MEYVLKCVIFFCGIYTAYKNQQWIIFFFKFIANFNPNSKIFENFSIYFIMLNEILYITL